MTFENAGNKFEVAIITKKHILSTISKQRSIFCQQFQNKEAYFVNNQNKEAYFVNNIKTKKHILCIIPNKVALTYLILTLK